MFSYLQWRVGKKIRRRSLRTSVLQIAKEQRRQFETARFRGFDNPLPTRTPIAEILNRYVEHIRHVKTPKSAQTDIYYLHEAFGPICDAVTITSRRVTCASKKRPPKQGQDRRFKPPVIEADCFEAITTADVSTFITSHARSRGLAPMTANRYREIIVRIFNWAMTQQGIRMPADRNPAAAVERQKEDAPEIRYLTLQQIDEQLAELTDMPQLQVMVATLIYSGLRREELLWLQRGDVELDRRLIQIRAKTVNGRSWQPKTKRNRAIPISTPLKQFLVQYSSRPALGDFYFPSPRGG